MKLLHAVRRRFRDANPEEIEALTLDAMREAVGAQLQPGNVEVWYTDILYWIMLYMHMYFRYFFKLKP